MKSLPCAQRLAHVKSPSRGEQPGIPESIEVVKGLAPDLDTEAVKSSLAMEI
jgi:hypothetical protein